MQIKITNDNEELILTNEQLNNLNFVEIAAVDEHGHRADLMMPLDKLYAAVKAMQSYADSVKSMHND